MRQLTDIERAAIRFQSEINKLRDMIDELKRENDELRSK